ncbi:MAG: recombinase family protein, partial [Gomphosphaeria aponina SAG 52.96 = DSM 107014]|nr:recombinase family protein [Gomphosphaeria aponina SAG 52.96 = DSM 107014]
MLENWGYQQKPCWDKSGKLVARRTLSNPRYYTEDDLRVAKGLQNQQTKRKTVIYCRVSSKKQKTELENQKHALIEFCDS